MLPLSPLQLPYWMAYQNGLKGAEVNNRAAEAMAQHKALQMYRQQEFQRQMAQLEAVQDQRSVENALNEKKFQAANGVPPQPYGGSQPLPAPDQGTQASGPMADPYGDASSAVSEPDYGSEQDVPPKSGEPSEDQPPTDTDTGSDAYSPPDESSIGTDSDLPSQGASPPEQSLIPQGVTPATPAQSNANAGAALPAPSQSPLSASALGRIEMARQTGSGPIFRQTLLEEQRAASTNERMEAGIRLRAQMAAQNKQAALDKGLTDQGNGYLLTPNGRLVHQDDDGIITAVGSGAKTIPNPNIPKGPESRDATSAMVEAAQAKNAFDAAVAKYGTASDDDKPGAKAMLDAAKLQLDNANTKLQIFQKRYKDLAPAAASPPSASIDQAQRWLSANPTHPQAQAVAERIQQLSGAPSQDDSDA